MITPETWGFVIVVGISILVGGIVGYWIYFFKNKAGRCMQKILKNPKLLVKELNKNGKMYDIGPNDVKEEIHIDTEIDMATGKEIVVMKRIPVVPKPVPKSSPQEGPEKKVKAVSSRKKGAKKTDSKVDHEK